MPAMSQLTLHGGQRLIEMAFVTRGYTAVPVISIIVSALVSRHQSASADQAGYDGRPVRGASLGFG
jgi:hypothetical protein